MKMMTFAVLGALTLVVTLAVPGAQAAGDREDGKKKFYTCVGCHGIEGYANSYPSYQVPRIGGQHAEYVVSALKTYQAGERPHASMQGNAISLSNEDLEDIAAYVSAFRAINVKLPIHGDVVAGKAKAQACAGCHGEDGNSPVGSGFPRLAGQYESYIVKTLQDYKAGKRKNPMMSGIAASLSAEDMENVAAYYASQQKGLIVMPD
jgi:cytochrome c553